MLDHFPLKGIIESNYELSLFVPSASDISFKLYVSMFLLLQEQLVVGAIDWLVLCLNAIIHIHTKSSWF